MNEKHEKIQRRAHELWEKSGQPKANDLDFWLLAEREIEGGVPAADKDQAGGQLLHIREHMQVISSDHKVVGKIDGMESAEIIKLTRESSPDGRVHHFIPVSWIDHVDQHIHLNRTGQDVINHWKIDPTEAQFPNF